MSEQAIRAFVQKHEGWIQEHLHIAEEQRKKYAEAPAQVRFLGKDCRVQLWQEKQVCLQDGVVYLPEMEDAAKQRAKLTAWYRQQAKELLGHGKFLPWLEELGVSESVVRLDGEELVVPTDALVFAEGVKDKHRIAAIYAPRLGRCILRAKASEKAKELDKCPAGRIVPVLEYGKTWTKIRYEGQIGYVKTAVLTFLGDKADPIGVGVTSYQGRATGSAKVPLRNGKTSDAEIILNLRTATEVKVLSFDGKWYELEHDGWYGFLYKTYFTYEEE